MTNGQRFVEGMYVGLVIGLAKLNDLIWGVNTEILTLSKYFRWNAILMVLLIALDLFLNWFFIPKYGLVGTALDTCLSVVVYLTFRGGLVWAKLKMHPFTKRQFYVILIFVGTGLMIHFIHFDFNPILEVVLRSGIILLATGGTIYVFKIVPDINKMIDKYIRFVIKKK
jgi:O-antigen/teichoic acid export membrane protein